MMIVKVDDGYEHEDGRSRF